MALDDLGGVCLKPGLGRAACRSNAAVVGVHTFHLVHHDPSLQPDVVVGTWLLTSRFAVAVSCHAVQ